MSLNTLKLAFTIEFITLALLRLTETKQWTPTASPADGQWRSRQLIQLLMSWCLSSLPLSLIVFTLQPSSLYTSFVLHPMALGKSSFMFSFFREPPFLWGSHYPRKGGCCSVWCTVSQWNCVYGLCKDSTFFFL